MKYVIFAAIAVILSTVITAYAAPRCFAVCSNGNCQQVCTQ
jgi:hypothetical protein